MIAVWVVLGALWVAFVGLVFARWADVKRIELLERVLVEITQNQADSLAAFARQLQDAQSHIIKHERLLGGRAGALGRN